MAAASNICNDHRNGAQVLATTDNVGGSSSDNSLLRQRRNRTFQSSGNEVLARISDVLNAMDSEEEVPFQIFQVSPSRRIVSVVGILCVVVCYWTIWLAVFANLNYPLPVKHQKKTTSHNDQGGDNMSVWPQVQEKLCPKQVPNLEYAPTLFQLARSQFGNHSEAEFAAQHKIRRQPKMVELTYRFFHGEFQPSAIFVPKSTNTAPLLYVNIWKAADTAIQQWMEATFAHSQQGNLTTMTFSDIFAKTTTTLMADPCIVTAIRDPISHFLSGYNEVEVRRSWLNDVTDYPLAHYWSLPVNTHEQRVARMEAFVENLIMEDSQALQHYIYKHVFSMTRILYELAQYRTSNENQKHPALTAYLSRLDNLNETFPTLLRDKCQQAVPSDVDLFHYNLNDYGQHKSSLDPDGFYAAAKEAWAQNGSTARALCALHAMDYACWSGQSASTAPSLSIPPICQQVFASRPFVTNILD